MLSDLEAIDQVNGPDVSSRMTFCVTVPTRDRPEKLRACLHSLRAEADAEDFEIVVADSSRDAAVQAEVARVCADVPNVRLVHHDGWNAAMARNRLTREARSDLIVSIDDDVTVEAGAIAALVAAARRSPGAMVAGTVRWGDKWSAPVKTRPIGYGRAVSGSENPYFLVSAFVAYPRELNLRLPWNEHLRREEDRFQGSLLRSHGVPLLFEPAARAVHHEEHNSTGPSDIGDRIYGNLFEALVVRRQRWRALSYLLIGFVFSAREFGLRCLPTMTRSWVRGVRSFLRDLPQLRAAVGDHAVGQRT